MQSINVSKEVARVVNFIHMSPDFKRVTSYVHPKFTIKATALQKPTKRDLSQTLVVTIGRPNYRECQFIKKCKKAGEPFPVKKLQITLRK